MGGGCSKSNDSTDLKITLTKFLETMLAKYQPSITAQMSDAGFDKIYTEVTVQLVGAALNEICDLLPCCETLAEVSVYEDKLYDTKLDSKDPGQIDMPKLFQLCKHVLGMSKCVMILRPVVLPPLKDMAAHMHASGIVDGTTISVFDQISQRATGSVLMSGFVPMLLGIADLRAAVDAGDATAVRQEAAKFGNVMLGEVHEEGVTYELLCQLEVYKWLRPAIELCVEEFEVFRRYLTMLVYAMNAAYLSGDPEVWIEVTTTVSQMQNQCRSLGDAQDRIRWLTTYACGIDITIALEECNSVEEAITGARSNRRLEPIGLQLLDATMHFSGNLVLSHHTPDLIDRLKTLKMFSNEAELTNACEGAAELCCGKAMVVEMVRRARLAFEDSAVGVVRKWNAKTSRTPSKPKLVAVEYIALLAAATRKARDGTKMHCAGVSAR